MAEHAFSAGIPEANDAVTVGGDDCIRAREQDGLSNQLRDIHNSTSEAGGLQNATQIEQGLSSS
jgi:hypothetical protein